MTSRCNFLKDPGLIFHLPLSDRDGNTFMSKDAYGHLCTAMGTTWRTDGRYFNGVNEYINLNNTFSIVSGTDSKTIIAQVTPTKTNFSITGRILSLQRSVTYTAFDIHVRANPATWRVYYSSGGITSPIELDSGIFLVAGQSVFLALVQEGSMIRFQVDKATVFSGNGGIPTIENPATAYIGAYDNNGIPTQLFTGFISEAFIFSRALSSIEVERIRLGIKR